LLFNALYAWQEELLQKNNVQLSVSALNIRLDNRPSETNSIGEYDSIRYFYLARENLFKTSASDLDAMLTSFWKRNMVQPEVIIAFEVLEISPTTDLKEIKRAYRKKIAVTHPDKGGCTRKAMDVNQALDVINTALGT
jgi:DnaJ-domain-containing protein 1